VPAPRRGACHGQRRPQTPARATRHLVRTHQFSLWPWCPARFGAFPGSLQLGCGLVASGRRWHRFREFFLRLGLADRPQPIAQAVQDVVDGAFGWHMPTLPFRISLQLLMHSLGSYADSCISSIMPMIGLCRRKPCRRRFWWAIPGPLGSPLAKSTRNNPDILSFWGVLSPRNERACD
jgi:hypothetical protein